MKRTARFFAAALAAAMLFASVGLLSGCAFSSSSDNVLHVYNWEDYISDEDDAENGYRDLIAAFEQDYKEKTGKTVTVEYSTFGTNENMYNELKINAAGYDLVCPSDYMIMKMIAEGMVEEFSEDFLQNGAYSTYVSPYIKELFDKNGWTNYAAAYMWGTMGYVYNPDYVDKEDLLSWAGIWSDKYQNKSTIKDSVRDSYFLGVAYVYREELNSLKAEYEAGAMTQETYNEAVTEIMNRTDEDTIESVKDALIDLKKYLYGFEVDSGKQDMITGKITINFAWSGDAVFAMDEAEESDTYLNYVIPEECSNIWFDGWVMPKGANTELAEAFINFLSEPENAVTNMNYIGYTSAVAGDAVFNEMLDWYSEGEEGDLDENGDPLVRHDLNYFFKGTGEIEDYSIWVSEESLDRQVGAQYPTEEVIERSAVMQYFDDDTNAAVNEMWEEIKGQPIPLWAYIVIAAVVVIGLLIGLSFLYKGKRSEPKPKKGYRVLKRGE